MKGMRALLLATAVLAAGPIAGSRIGAQVTTAPVVTGKAPARHMVDLELTRAQKSQLAEIQRKYEPELIALREEMRTGAERADLLRKHKALRERSGADIRAILTPAQQAVFDRNMAELKARLDQLERQQPPGD